VTGPLFGSETLAARLYVAARERDGYNDVVTGKGPSDRDEDADQGFYTVRGQLLFVPDDKSTFKLIADYTKRDENCCGAVQIRTGPTAGDPQRPGRRPGPGLAGRSLRPRRLFQPRRTVVDRGQGRLAARRHRPADRHPDLDLGHPQLAHRQRPGRGLHHRRPGLSQQGRHQLRRVHDLQPGTPPGRPDRAFDWLVGAFLADERLDNKANFLYGNDYEQYLGRLLSAGGSRPAASPTSSPCC
jgi:iron complex outermembrane receptor protein